MSEGRILTIWDWLSFFFFFGFLGWRLDAVDPYRLSGKERKLGLMVCRGTSVMTISPLDGVMQIDNPFLQGDT